MRHSESWLFCTPPPEDVQARVNGRNEKEGSTSTVANEPDMGTEYLEEKRNDVLLDLPQELLAKPYCSQKTCAHPRKKPRAHSIQLQNQEQVVAKPTGGMAPHRASLTSTADGANADTKTSVLARPNASSLKTHGSHLTTSKPGTARSVSKPCSSRGANQTTAFLGQLAGYSSSEEDEIGHDFEAPGGLKVSQSDHGASREKTLRLSDKLDGPPPPKYLRDVAAAGFNITPDQRRSAMMASKNGSTTKRQAASPTPAKHSKRRKRTAFKESSDDDSTSEIDSTENDDDSLSQHNGDNTSYPKMPRVNLMSGRSLVPSGPPPRVDRRSVQDIKNRLANMKKKKEDEAPDRPGRSASGTQPRLTNSTAAPPHQMKSQIGDLQRASLQVPKAEKTSQQEEKRHVSKNGSAPRPENPGPMRASATAPSASFSRPSKAIPSAALRSTSSVSRAPESCQPSTKAHTNGTGISGSRHAPKTNDLNRSNRAPAGGAPKPAPPQKQASVVSNNLGDIRQNGTRGESAVRQPMSTPSIVQKPPSQKTSVYKELHTPRSITDPSTSRRSQNEIHAGPKLQQPKIPGRALGVTRGGKDVTNSVASHRSSAYQSASSPDVPQLPTPKTASPAQKRKIDDVSNDLGSPEPSSKKIVGPATSDSSTARSEAQVSVRQKSTRVSTTDSSSKSESAPSHTPLGNTSEATKSTIVPKASSSFAPSRKSSVSAPSARKSAPATEAMAKHSLEQQLLKPRNPSEVPKVVAESSNATNDNIPPSRPNNVATEVSVSRVELHRSPIVTKPSLVEDDHHAVKSSTTAPRPKSQPHIAGVHRVSNQSTQKPLGTASLKGPTASVALPPSSIVANEKEKSATSGMVSPGKLQSDVASNNSLAMNRGKFEKEGTALAESAEKPPKSQDPEDFSTLTTQRAISQSSVGCSTVDLGSPSPESASSKVSDVGAPLEAQRSDHRKNSVSPEVPKSPLDPEPAAEVLPAKKQATKGKEPAATPVVPAILSMPSREDVLKPAVDSAIDIPTSAALPKDVEPFFEYSVLQKISTDADEASSDDDLVLSSSCTNIEEANAQAKRVFDNMCVQYQQHFAIHFSEATNKRDDDGCDQLVGTFAPVDHPTKQNFLKVWVRRDIVSQYACQTPKDVKFTSFIAKTVYVVRLFMLRPIAPDSDGKNTQAGFMRVHHPHLRAECYTTLSGANRAAKNLQIELSHKSKPEGPDKFWQEDELAKLNKKMMDLEAASDGEEKCWRSEFNGSGLGSDKYELFVEKAGLCGPRNL